MEHIGSLIVPGFRNSSTKIVGKDIMMMKELNVPFGINSCLRNALTKEPDPSRHIH